VGVFAVVATWRNIWKRVKNKKGGKSEENKEENCDSRNNIGSFDSVGYDNENRNSVGHY
jgi:hypothetical protein